MAGRLIVVARGEKSETVNVCTARNEVGVYETKYRLPAAVTVTVEVLNELINLVALDAWVLAHEGVAEDVGSGPGRVVPPLVPVAPSDDAWLERAQAATEQVLDAVVRDFLRAPRTCTALSTPCVPGS